MYNFYIPNTLGSVFFKGQIKNKLKGGIKYSDKQRKELI